MQPRIIDNATIHETPIEPDKLEAIQKIMNAIVTHSVEKRVIKELTGRSTCFGCDGIPTLEVRYPVKDGGATKIERYCEACIKKLYEREPVL
jgi:hypothetical protein